MEHNYEYYDRVARVYMPNMKSTQCHPKEKNGINHWVIEFESWGSFKSHLMGWNKANSDAYQNLRVQASTVEDAIYICERMGWGYDIQYPTKRYHSRKSYADNCLWRGEPKKEPQYD